MEEPSHSKIQKRSEELDLASSLPAPKDWKYRSTFFLTLGIGVVVVGVLMAIGSGVATVWLGYVMPTHLGLVTVIPAVLLVLLLVGAELFLKPKPLSNTERNRFIELKGETQEEIKELIEFNLRTGNREKATEWAKKALELSKSDSVPKIEKKN